MSTGSEILQATLKFQVRISFRTGMRVYALEHEVMCQE